MPVSQAEFLTHEGGNQAAQVGAAAGAADDHVGLDAVFVERRLGLKTDDGLVQEDLIEDGAEHIAVTGIGDRDFYRLGDRAAEGAGGAGVLSEDLAADLRRVRRRRRHGSAVGAHDFTAEGFLFVAYLDHVYLAVQVKIGAGHRERCAPLAGAGLGGHALETLFFGVIGLGNGGVELVASTGVVALELVIDVRRGLQLLLQAVRAHQRRRAVHLIEILDLFRDRDIGIFVVELLSDQFLTEHGAELLSRHGLKGSGVEKGSGLVLHISPDIVPCLGDLVFGEIDLVGNLLIFFVCHGFFLSGAQAPFAMDHLALTAPAAFVCLGRKSYS